MYLVKTHLRRPDLLRQKSNIQLYTCLKIAETCHAMIEFVKYTK